MDTVTVSTVCPLLHTPSPFSTPPLSDSKNVERAVSDYSPRNLSAFSQSNLRWTSTS
jgi:hypothetical protein